MPSSGTLGGSGSVADYLPRWTARVSTESRVRDPLGMSAYAHNLTDSLLPGITSTTYLARYYSIYCWILWHIGEVERPQTEEANSAAFLRREAAFALATLLDPDSGGTKPLGEQAVQKQLDGSQEHLLLDFRVLPSARYGGFGANYGGSMYTLGLWQRSTPIRDEPTAGLATDLALAVDNTLRRTPFHVKRLWTQPRIPRADLAASASALSLAAIRRPECARERRLLTDMLFALDARGASGVGSRPQSLSLLLWLAGAYARADVPCPTDPVEVHFLYAPLYHGVLAGPEGLSVPLGELPHRLANCRDCWRHFCAHQYLTVALEQLFCALLRVLASGSATVREVVAAWLSEGFAARISSRAQLPGERPAALVDALLAARASGSERFALHGPLSEETLTSDPDTSPADLASRAVLVLLVLYARGYASIPAVFPVGEGHIVLEHVRPLVERWREPALGWADALAELFERWLLPHHQGVNYHRRLLDSAWIETYQRPTDRLVFRQELWPRFRNSRLRPAVYILRDLLLLAPEPLADGAERLVLTAEGRAILERTLGGAA